MKESQIKLLEALAQFKFLNTFHMVSLGIVKHRDNLYRIFPSIRDCKRPYIKRQKMPVLASHGQHPDVYYLTKKGALWLEENLILEPEQIRYPVGEITITTRDYIHRMATIDIHVGLQQWLDETRAEMLNVSGYFDKPGAQRKGQPRIVNKMELSDNQYLLPDLITHFKMGDDEKFIVWEQHNGKDTKKLLKQVHAHILGLKKRVVAKKYGSDKLHRVGVVFEHSSIMEATLGRLQEQYSDDSDLYRLFIFKTNQQAKDDFYNHWTHWNGEITTLIN